MNNMPLAGTPLASVNYHFANYVSDKKLMASKHTGGNGLPDYAYIMDYEHRKHLDSIPGLYNLAKKLCATEVPRQIQIYNMEGVAVGPSQYPEVYKMVRECAETLGIGIPNVIIIPSLEGDDFNACTCATDDVEPVILITGLMLERMSAEELKVIIAHECGHIHNHHSLYGMLENYIVSIGVNGILALPGLSHLMESISKGALVALQTWSRAAEVTADRAALICSGSVEVTRNALSKFMYRGANLSGTVESELNLEALREQLDMTLNNPLRLNELFRSHPLTMKRVFAVSDFSQCDNFYEWRPDLKTPGQKSYPKEDVDKKCKQYIDVVLPEGGKKK